ncbi:MAG: hypothetical protein JW797_16330 [Bradymonadales bacterium]|nr:hypothetical protein [Bradymonadales bacterium]
MIPVTLYREKLHDLEYVLEKMGKDPKSVSNWFLDSIQRGQLDMVAIARKGMESLKLVQSLPATTINSVLGIKLTEPRRMDIVQQIQSLNEERIRQDLSDIGSIEETLRRLAYNVTQRIYAVRQRVGQLEQQSARDLDKAHEISLITNQLSGSVIPVLMRLRDEIMAGLDQCGRELKVRVDQLHFVLWRSAWSPKFSKKVWRKRMMRLKRRKAEEEKKKKEQEESDTPT